jgi:hypothetical protein
MWLRLLCVCSLFLLIACQSLPVDHSKVEKENKKNYLLQILDKKMKQEAYSFIIKTTRDQFHGKLNGENWEIKKENHFSLEKKENKIQLKKGTESEELLVDQLGLISPRDHFLLVKEAGKLIHQPENISWEKKQAKKLNVPINHEKLSERLKKRFLSNKPVIQLSEKVKVVYQFIYIPDTYDLKQMSIRLQTVQGSVQEVTYLFS